MPRACLLFACLLMSMGAASSAEGPGGVADLRQRALEHRIHGERNAEVAELKSLLAASPMDIGARFALAVALEELGEAEEAARQFEPLVDQEALRAPSLVHLAALERAGGSAARAVERYRALASGHRRDPIAYGRLAETLRAVGGLEGELAALDSPPSAWDAARRALLLQAAGRLPEARAAALDALLLDPADPAARYCAQWLADGGRSPGDESVAVARPASEDAAADERPLLAGALLRRWRGKDDAALSMAERAAVLRPDHAVVHLILGETLVSLPSRRNDALAELRRALELDPALLPAYVTLGRLHLLEGRARDAELAARAALGADPLFAPAYSLLGEAHLAAGAPDQALVAFKSALHLDPYDLDGRGRPGFYRALDRLGRGREAPVFLRSMLPQDESALEQERERFERSLPPGTGRVRTLAAGKALGFLAAAGQGTDEGCDGRCRSLPPFRILADGSLLHPKGVKERTESRQRPREVTP